jgi:iron complex outermembrane receptor protein
MERLVKNQFHGVSRARPRPRSGRFRFENTPWHVARAALAAWLFCAALSPGLLAQDQSAPTPQAKTDELANKSLEDLMKVEVTSVSKKEQRLAQTASAVFVISQDDIRRSGATNIPDLLRMVPGVEVAQINANTWAISARGLNARFSNELLVLLDGRSVYTPTTGGVFWDVLDVPLENIERIEVIRGPGASVWGANAVNGVINIITKRASDTQGALVSGEAGMQNTGQGLVEYGGRAGKDTSFRAFAKYLTAADLPGLAGGDGGDGWSVARMGFRSDTDLNAKESLTFEGELYRGREGNPFMNVATPTAPLVPQQMQVNLGGGYFLGVWNHTTSQRSGTSLQVSYDNYERNDALRESRGTWDVQFQNHFGWGERQTLNWGAEYRFSQSDAAGSALVSLNPPDKRTQFFSSFVQDEIAVVPGRLFFTIGTKLEHDAYAGFDAMPSVRLAWTPDERQLFWAAVSDADRNPAATDVSIVASLGGFTGPNGPVALRLYGNPSFEPEKTVSYEAGYRASVSATLSLDFATYYSAYYDQETTEPGTPFVVDSAGGDYTVMPLVYGNLMHGESPGAEIYGNWKISNRWTLSPGYAFQAIHMHLEAPSQDEDSKAAAEGSTPRHTAQLRSHFSILPSLSWDASAYFTGRLADPEIPSYTRLDTGLTWEWKKKSYFSLVGQNLLRDRHEEFVDPESGENATLIRRRAYVKWTWKF